MGADHRLFEGLHRAGLSFEALDFIPAVKGETLPEYARRMAALVDTSQPFLLGGVSLGGIIAGEMAMALGAEELVLISSVKDSGELPPYFRLAKWLPVHRLFSGGFLKKNSPKAGRRKLAPWQAKILRDLRVDADDAFIEWAVDAVVCWRRRTQPRRVLHIHGTRDLMFPGVFLRDRIKVPGGRHVMVVTHGDLLAGEIRKWMGD